MLFMRRGRREREGERAWQGRVCEREREREREGEWECFEFEGFAAAARLAPTRPDPFMAKAMLQHKGPAGFQAAGPSPPGSGTLRILAPTKVGAGADRDSAEVQAADIMEMLDRRSLVGAGG